MQYRRVYNVEPGLLLPFFVLTPKMTPYGVRTRLMNDVGQLQQTIEIVYHLQLLPKKKKNRSLIKKAT